jgi:hypothetical protein
MKTKTTIKLMNFKELDLKKEPPNGSAQTSNSSTKPKKKVSENMLLEPEANLLRYPSLGLSTSKCQSTFMKQSTQVSSGLHSNNNEHLLGNNLSESKTFSAFLNSNNPNSTFRMPSQIYSKMNSINSNLENTRMTLH